MKKILSIYILFTGFILASTFDNLTLGMNIKDAKSIIDKHNYKIKKQTNEVIQYESEVLTFNANVTLHFTALNHKLYKIEIIWFRFLRRIPTPNVNNPDSFMYEHWSDVSKQNRIEMNNTIIFRKNILITLEGKYGNYNLEEGVHVWKFNQNLIVRLIMPDGKRYNGKKYIYHELIYFDPEISRDKDMEINKFKKMKAKQEKEEMMNFMQKDLHRF